ncbi:hypothetical protein MUN84_06725 [Hymenobacter sp. 5516J-16]|uniref:hypothetical protein n=1 Tax=Hymenobacter sp. 5516J-16 TaxID=2932253 RepID=UPI001FD21DFD|nr:hypothetical protein [Hymenobacter sp. 5516J-16]UOQ78272.1 hypothetical protein MUN84_06725 [Hymenobacter sp. 5516J-16]
MRKLYAFNFFLFFTFFTTLPSQAQQYYLNLSQQTIQLPARTIYVEQVLDGRANKSSIGLVYRKLDNRPTAVLFRNGLETELTTFLQKQLPARPTDRPVVLCLRQLRVSEVLNGFTEEASADLAADVYAHLPDGYHFMQSIAARRTKSAMETTRFHDNHLAALLQECLGQVQDASWQRAAATPAQPLELLRSTMSTTTSDPAAALPAILRKAPRAGIYYTFEQFLANLPDSTSLVQLDTIPSKLGGQMSRILWAGVQQIRPFVYNNYIKKHIPLDAWAYSDGWQLYVQHQKKYFPLVRQRNFFTFVGEAPLDLEYARARSEAQVRAGAMGVATVRAPDHTGEPTGYEVDMRTGQLAPYPSPLQSRPAHPDTCYIYIYRRADAITAPATVFMGTKQVSYIGPNEYMEIRWPYYGRILRLEVRLPGADFCQLLIPDAAQPSYLEVSADAPSNHRPAWRWVPAAQGEIDLDELDKLRESAGK